jgi:hypothetical protein
MDLCVLPCNFKVHNEVCSADAVQDVWGAGIIIGIHQVALSLSLVGSSALQF